MELDTASTAWALLLGSTYSLTIAAIIIALLFRYKIILLIAAHGIFSSLIISCLCIEANNDLPDQQLLFHSLNLGLLSIFIAIVGSWLSPFYRSINLNLWWLALPLLVTTPTVIICPLGTNIGFLIGTITLLAICLGLSLYAFGHLATSITAIALSASKLILALTMAYLSFNTQNIQMATDEISIGTSILYWLDFVVLTSFCWLAFYRMNMEQVKQKIATARQEIKIASISPLVQAGRHELRTPLANIIGLADLIDDGPLDQQQRKSLIALKHSARQGLESINQLFTFGGKNGATLDVTPPDAPFSVAALIKDCAQYYSYYLEQQKKELVIQIAYLDDYTFSGQHEKIRQLLMHTLEYFLVHLKTKEVLLKASLHDQQFLHITLSQTSKNTFQSMVENSAPIKTAQILARDLGGSLHIDSQGIEVDVEIPVHAQLNTQTSSELSAQLIGKRILVLDDNVTACNVVVAYLERLSVAASYCTNCIDATAKLHHQFDIGDPIDLVIVDYVMPDMDGVAFIKQTLADTKLPQQPEFIIMSSTSQLANSQDVHALGVDFVLEKPVMPDTLKLALINELALRNQSAHLSTHRALVIEDNAISAKITHAIIQKNNIDCEVVSSGYEAINSVKHKRYDLIFIDLNLDDIDGLELLKNIKHHTQKSTTEPLFIALTAENSKLKIQQSLSAGMNKFISKPLTQNKLIEILDEFSKLQTC